MFEFSVEGSALSLEVLEVFDLDGQGGLEGSFEGDSELVEPLAVFFGPGGFTLGEDEAVVAEYSGNTVFGGLAV